MGTGLRGATARALRRAATSLAPELPGPSDGAPEPRWGYGRAAHPELEAIVAAGTERFAATLRAWLPLVDELSAIPFEATDGRTPFWTNGYFQGLDAAALYTWLVQRRPRRYVEVGAGNSTRFARRAIERHGLATTITSIDPEPRAPVADLADVHHACALEDIHPSPFDDLVAGDVVLFDGSHVAHPGGDVVTFFVEVLPRLAPGVLVGVDDVFLPWDYPRQLGHLRWSEQYLVAAWLLGGERLVVELPCFWICTQPSLHGILSPLWNRFTWAAVPTNGTTMWLSTRS